MKVTHLNTSDIGGAGIAARNLHLGILKAGLQSSFVSKYRLGKEFENHTVLKPKKRTLLERLGHRINTFAGVNESTEHYYLQGRKAGFEHFSFPWSDLEPFSLGQIREADILHLHWVSDGFIDYGKIFVPGRKYVWTLHDMNPFTGGCHHSDGCMKFITNCNYSFQLEGSRDEYLSGKILAYKLKSLEKVKTEDMVIVTPSRWLSDLSQKSTLFSRFRHEVIFNPQQLSEHLVDRASARAKFGIKEDQVVFLFVSHQVQNKRKGIDILLQAINEINDPSVVVLALGEKMQLSEEALPVKQIGYVSDPLLIKEIYTAADVFLLPSLAENFPNTIVEALMCGTPVIASNVGGIPEQINGDNGMLVELNNPDAWVSAMRQFVSNRGSFVRSRISADAANKYSNESIVQQYLKVYKTLFP